jgi:hypothetical protein
MFDCIITVSGNGKGGNGRFKLDKTDRVERFMVDNVHLYTEVKKHVVDCPKCDPTAALRHYLLRRLTMDKFQPKPGAHWPVAGMLTVSLAKLAVSYERLCRKIRPIPTALVNEFIWRSADAGLIEARGYSMPVRDLVSAVQLMLLRNGGTTPTNIRPGTRLGMVAQLLQHHAAPTTEQELEDLMAVADVQIS